MKDTRHLPELEVSELQLGYEGRRGFVSTLSQPLTLRLKPGEFVCLLGPNGVGKSTLIRTLAGMQGPLAGQVWLGGKALETMTPQERARIISVVLTDSLPVGLFTAYAVVALGRHPHTNWTGNLTAHDRKRIQWAMEAVDASSLAQRQISELSDGERQKVMIARALAQETSIILLDEPTAFLDLPRRVELMRTLCGLARSSGLSILLSTHDLDLALRSADRLWLFDREGDITVGVPEALALDGKIAAVFRADALDWDVELGSFRMHREPSAVISFRGQGPVGAWTRRALSRIGYGVVATPNPLYPSLEVEEHDGGWIWSLSAGDGRHTFTALEWLIAHLSIRVNENE